MTTSISDKQQLVGEMLALEPNKWLKVAVKNRFSIGDSVDLITPYAIATVGLS